MDDVFKDAMATDVSSSQLADIASLANSAVELQGECDALESALKVAKAALHIKLSRELVEAMDAVGVANFKTTTGALVEIKDFVSASIPAAHKAEAFEWLRQNNHSDLIKHVISISLGKEHDNVAQDIIAVVRDNYGVEPTDKESVHPQTLSAFCREQKEAGVELPEDILGVFARRVAKIKL